MLTHIISLVADVLWLPVAAYSMIVNRRIKRMVKRSKATLEQATRTLEIIRGIQPGLPLIEYTRYLVLNKNNMN